MEVPGGSHIFGFFLHRPGSLKSGILFKKAKFLICALCAMCKLVYIEISHLFGFKNFEILPFSSFLARTWGFHYFFSNCFPTFPELRAVKRAEIWGVSFFGFFFAQSAPGGGSCFLGRFYVGGWFKDKFRKECKIKKKIKYQPANIGILNGGRGGE